MNFTCTARQLDIRTYFPVFTSDMIWLAVVCIILLRCVRWRDRRGRLRTWTIWWRNLAIHVHPSRASHKRVKILFSRMRETSLVPRPHPLARELARARGWGLAHARRTVYVPRADRTFDHIMCMWCASENTKLMAGMRFNDRAIQRHTQNSTATKTEAHSLSTPLEEGFWLLLAQMSRYWHFPQCLLLQPMLIHVHVCRKNQHKRYNYNTKVTLTLMR